MDVVTKWEYFTEGKRGCLFIKEIDGQKMVMKKKNPKSKAIHRIENEISWLKRLNPKGIGPKLIESGKDFFVYEFVDGVFLPDYLVDCSKKDAIRVLTEVFKQCFVMDQMLVDKEEMHHPFKHVLVSKERVVMIDFERCNSTEHPKNVTQFCQYVCSANIRPLLLEKKFEFDVKDVSRLAKKYKGSYSKDDFDEILGLFE